MKCNKKFELFVETESIGLEWKAILFSLKLSLRSTMQ